LTVIPTKFPGDISQSHLKKDNDGLPGSGKFVIFGDMSKKTGDSAYRAGIQSGASDNWLS